MKRCSKVSFSDEKQAEIYLAKLKKTSNRRLIPIRSYLCEKCLAWHITSNQDMTTVYKDRQIKNLKAKVAHLENEVERLKNLVPWHENNP